jgi:hypothetical protein
LFAAAADVGQNTWELWKFRTGGGWFHPIHMHLVDFFVLKRGSNFGSDGLFSFERDSPKDIVFLGPNQEIWVISRWVGVTFEGLVHMKNTQPKPKPKPAKPTEPADQHLQRNFTHESCRMANDHPYGWQFVQPPDKCTMHCLKACAFLYVQVWSSPRKLHVPL